MQDIFQYINNTKLQVEDREKEQEHGMDVRGLEKALVIAKGFHGKMTSALVLEGY